MNETRFGDRGAEAAWLSTEKHRDALAADAERQVAFFRRSLRDDGGFDILDHDGTPLPRGPQELHTTTRMIHSYALAKAAGFDGSDEVIDAGMVFLTRRHRDPDHGGFFWSVEGGGATDDTKLAYGHVFVLLAGASAAQAGHPDGGALLAEAGDLIEAHFWDETAGLLRDEARRDWTPFSSYRGMNANMHGVEAMLAAYEAAGEKVWLDRAGRILDFFVGRIAPRYHWRLPEHYDENWTVDPDYAGNPMFRPAGTTPGHSLELGRLMLQHWDLGGRGDDGAPHAARRLIERALADAWREDGGLVYTLGLDGRVAIADRYWWPVTEAIGAVAALIKADPQPGDEEWYRKLWRFADLAYVDAGRGGWYPEIDDEGRPVSRQFAGKPDLYHSLQAVLFPPLDGVSRPFDALKRAEAARRAV